MENIKEFYYYLRYDNKPVITICLGVDVEGGFSHRGISICSNNDFPVKKVGKEIARGRMLKAFYSEKTTMLINRDDVKSIRNNCIGNIKNEGLIKNSWIQNLLWRYKSEYCCCPTNYEQNLVDKVINVNKNNNINR